MSSDPGVIMASYEPVTALLRGLEVLEAMAGQSPSTIRGLHAATQIPKPTLVRILETLTFAGFVDSGDKGYTLTSRLLGLTSRADLNARLREIAEPCLFRFQAEVAWPADVAVLDRDAMVIVASSRSRSLIGSSSVTGNRIAASRSAIGRAFLSALAHDLRRGHLEVVARADGISPERMESELAVVRARGYSLSQQEPEGALRAIAAPVRKGGHVIASISLLVARDAMTMAEIEHHYAKKLLAVAEELSSAL